MLSRRNLLAGIAGATLGVKAEPVGVISNFSRHIPPTTALLAPDATFYFFGDSIHVITEEGDISAFPFSPHGIQPSHR